MADITGGFGEIDLLSQRMQSQSAVSKGLLSPAKADDKAGSAGVGNVLDSFGNVLKDQMQHINDLQNQANEAEQTYATGGDIELHNVLIASEKADLSLQLAMQVRNKIISAYQEISRMNV